MAKVQVAVASLVDEVVLANTPRRCIVSTSKKILFVLGAIALILLCAGCGLVGSFQSTQITLLDLQQKEQRGDSQYHGALDIVTQKIIGAFDLADRQIAHEDRAYQLLSEARQNYENAAATGTPPEQVQAAQGFSLAFQALAEDNPEFASAAVVQDAMNTMEEAVNEVFTAFQDWQDAVLNYNRYRGQLFMPLFVGNTLGFPRAFDYYEGVNQSLDMRELIPSTPAP